MSSVLRDQWNAVSQEGDAAIRDRIWKRVERKLGWRRAGRVFRYAVLSSMAVAACLAVGYFAGLRSLPEPEPAVQSWVAADASGRLLPDGSRVYLEKGAVLRFDDLFAENRRVSLTGAASFDITKQPDGKTFTIDLDGASITVHGTSFSVRQNVSEIDVTLYEGIVDFETFGRTTRLHPAESLSYSRESGQVSVQPFFPGIRWSAGRYNLSNMNLSEIMDFISWRYGVKVMMTGIPKANRCLIGSIGVDEPLEAALDKICYVLHLRYRMEDGCVSITKD